MSEAIQKFDNEYLHLRKLLIRGDFNLGDARIWLIAKAEEAVQATVVEKLNRMERYPHVDRDMFQLKKCMKDMGHITGEDDD